MRKWLRNRVERQAYLMGAMMEHLRVDPAAAVLRDRAFAAATRRCLWCGVSDQCRQWLDVDRASESATPDLCVNAPFFSELRSGLAPRSASP
jgi:hypothetical protein